MAQKVVSSDKKRILFFVHYNKYDELSEHVVYLLQHIAKIYSKIVLISNSTLASNDLERLDGLYTTFIQRENIGFDFGAWKDALLHEGWDALAEYDSVTLMNDTCFGPLFDLADTYSTMESRVADFWGLVKISAADIGMPGTNRAVPEHLQSYFLCFKNAVVISCCFREFWENVLFETDINAAIQKYETQLTTYLFDNGFCYDTMLSSGKKQLVLMDVAVKRPDLILDHKIPFIKIKAFTENQIFINIYTMKMIENDTNYPISLIERHCSFQFEPNISLKISSKVLPLCKKTYFDSPIILQSVRIAIHVHAFYIDIFESMLDKLQEIPFYFNLYITTDTNKKAEQIYKIIQNKNIFQLTNVIVTGNKGRDVYPWLLISDALNDYDLVCHIHTKKSSAAEVLIGKIWLQELLDLLIGNCAFIVSAFINDKTLGIVIPDVPSFFQFEAPQFFSKNVVLQRLMQNLWENLHCKKSISFATKKCVIFPYGNMFWYRPKALSPLFNLAIDEMEVPSEPLSSDGTILHALERLPVYVSWSEGYDYRIIMNSDVPATGFLHNEILNKDFKEIEAERISRYKTLASQIRNRFIKKL